MFSLWRFSPLNSPILLPNGNGSFYHVHSLSSNTNLSKLLQGRISHPHLLEIHCRVIRVGADQDNLIATRLIGQYPSPFALRVFSMLKNPNIFPYNAIIKVLAQNGLSSQSFLLFKSLKTRSFWPNDLTFSFLFKACFQSKNDFYAKQVHTHVVKMGFLCDSNVCNGLLLVYAKGVKDLFSAHKLFHELPDRSIVSCWTSLIAGHAQAGHSEEVLQLFSLMIRENLQPEDATMVSVLSACSTLGTSKIEKWVTVLSQFMVDTDLKNYARNWVNTVLIYLYGKWGKIEKSREMFDEIDDNGKRSVLPWNAIIGAYVQNGFHVEALSLFRLMVDEHSCKPNHVTMVSVLSACAQVGDFDLGKRVHKYMKFEGSKNILASNTFLATALIDMYSKCGNLVSAKQVFDQLVLKDVITFNAMIMGLAVNGEGEEALRLFSKMQEFGLHPNAGTFLGVLCACNHSGLLEKGRRIFLDMSSCFSVTPRLEHYSCYIDLLSRVGLIEEALEVVSSMPFEPNHFVLGALLGGCLLHSRVDLAHAISRELVDMDPKNSAGYVMLSNAFANDCRWSDVSMLRWFMREKGVKKQPGSSWISINGVIHEFLVGFPSHPQIESICHTICGLTNEMEVANTR